MLSFHLRRFFATTLPKLNSFKHAKEVAPTRLKKDEIKELIKEYNLNSWRYATHLTEVDVQTDNVSKHQTKETHYLEKTFLFLDFKQAFHFMDTVANIVDQMDHHPNWEQIENEVDVRLSTHDVGDTVSYKDIVLARAMDHVAKQLQYREVKFALQEEKLDPDSILKEALDEENIKKERIAAEGSPTESSQGRKVPDSRQELPSKQSSDIQSSKKPGEKSGDSTSSAHYSQKPNI